MKLIIGLGNPGKEYINTRHNIGFSILDNYLKDVSFKEKFNGLYYDIIRNGEKVIFLKPQTFMNNSGDCVVKFVKYYDVEFHDIMVIQDDLDIEIGKYKFKINSSSGGHNGIKSIINNLNTNSFFRMKIGIKDNSNNNVIDFVLEKFNNHDLNLLNYELYNNVIEDFIRYDYEYVMNKYNRK